MSILKNYSFVDNTLETDLSIEESEELQSSFSASRAKTQTQDERPVSGKKNRKRKRTLLEDSVEKELISSIKALKDDTADDEEGSFANAVASRLRRLTPRQKAIAYLEIDKVLLRLQYPEDPNFNSPPAAPITYGYPSHYVTQHMPQSLQHLATSQHQTTSQHVTFSSPPSLIPQPNSGTEEPNFNY